MPSAAVSDAGLASVKGCTSSACRGASCGDHCLKGGKAGGQHWWFVERTICK